MTDISDEKSRFTEFVAAQLLSLALKPMRASHAGARRATKWDIASRGLTRLQAAALVGLSPTAFDKARREGKYPHPTLPGGRYDRILIEKTMDRLSAINKEETPSSALDAWRDRGLRSY